MSDGGAPDREAELLALRLRVEGLERELGATSTALAVRTALLDARRGRRAVRALDRLAAVAGGASAAGAVAGGWTGLPDGGVRVPLAGLAPHGDAAVPAWTDAIDVGGVSLGGAPADPPARWAWALRDVPSGTVARAFAAVRPAAWAFNRGGVRFRLAVEGPDGTTRAEAVRDVHPGARGGDRAWVPLHLPVPAGDDDVVLVLSTALPPDAPPDFAWAVWGDPVLLVPSPGGEASALPRRAERWRAAAATARPRRRAAATAPPESAAGPSLTFLMPVHDPDPELLDATLRSVLDQADPSWRLCIADDGSRDAAVRARLEEASRDPRIDLQRHEAAQGISAATNLALAHATGTFVATLDHDDLLTPDAVGAVRARLAAQPGLDVLYSDNDKVAGEVRFAPSLKPGWSPELLRALMYTLHLGVYRRALVEETGGWRSDFDGAQDHDLLLRLSERTQRIAHLPRTLYSWRAHEGSAALGDVVKAHAYDRGVAAVAEHLERTGADATAERLPQAGRYRVVYRPRAGERVAVAAVGAPLPDAEVVVLCAAPATPAAEDWAAELAGPLRLDGVVAAAPVVLDAAGRVAEAGVAIAGGLPLPLFAGEAPDAHPELTVVCDRAAAGLVVAVRRDVVERAGCDATLGPLALADLTARLTAGGDRVAVTPHAPWRLAGPAPASLGAMRRFRDAHAGRADRFVNPRLWSDRAGQVVPRALQQTGLLADLEDAG